MSMQEKQMRISGLKSFRKNTAKKPEYHCGNCKCYRYSPCGCQRKVSGK